MPVKDNVMFNEKFKLRHLISQSILVALAVYGFILFMTLIGEPLITGG